MRYNVICVWVDGYVVEVASCATTRASEGRKLDELGVEPNYRKPYRCTSWRLNGMWCRMYRCEDTMMMWRNQTEVWHIRRSANSLEGNELQVVEVNDSRLDAVLQVERVRYLPIHFLI